MLYYTFINYPNSIRKVNTEAIVPDCSLESGYSRQLENFTGNIGGGGLQVFRKDSVINIYNKFIF